MMQSAKPRPLSATEIEFRKFVDLTREQKTLPDMSINGNMGKFHSIAEDLAEAFQQYGYDGFTNALEAAQKSDRDVNIALSSQIPTSDQETLPTELKIGRKGKKVFVTLTEDDVDELPDVKYLISGLIQTGNVSLLFGDSNAGKTFVALHTAQCIGRGINWLGRPVKQGSVLYIYAEGKLGLKPRLQAWRSHYNLPTTHEVHYIAHPVQLLSDREILIDTLEDQEQSPALVIIDTFSNCASGVKQNDQDEVYKVLAVAQEIASTYGGHVMVIHHTNKAGAFNGTAAFKNHVDTMIELSREDNDSPIILKCAKQREAAYFADIKLSLKVIDLGINEETCEEITSCVVTACTETTRSETAVIETTEKERTAMLSVLRLHKRLTLRGWIAAAKEVEVTKKAFYQHMAYFKSQKLLTIDERGKGKPTYFELAYGVEQTSIEAVIEAVQEMDNESVPTVQRTLENTKNTTVTVPTVPTPIGVEQ